MTAEGDRRYKPADPVAETPVEQLPEAHLIGHECSWKAINVQHPPVMFPGMQQQHTIVLLACTTCHLPDTVTLAGKWELGQLR